MGLRGETQVFQSQEGKQQLQGLDERPRDQQVSYYDSASDGNSCECGTRLTRSQLAQLFVDRIPGDAITRSIGFSYTNKLMFLVSLG